MEVYRLNDQTHYIFPDQLNDTKIQTEFIFILKTYMENYVPDYK